MVHTVPVARPSRHSFVLMLLAALLPLTACGSDDESGATKVGEVVPARAGVDTTNSPKGFLMLPSGRLDIRVGHPVMRLDEEATTEREVRNAPEGGVFLGVTWTFGEGDMGVYDKIFGQPLPLEMTLTSGGKEYPLAPPRLARVGAESDAYYVAVEGDGEDAVIEVEYAGVTQTLDLVTGKRETGEAQRLYQLDPSKVTDEPLPCPSEDWIDEGPNVRATFSCTRYGTIVVPFVDGEWAPKDSSFVVVGLTSSLTAFFEFNDDGGVARYTVTSSKEKSKLDGEPPTQVLEETVAAGGAAGALVFTVSGEVPDALTFHRTYTLARQLVQGTIDAPYSRKVDIIGDLPLR
jgi:hypothetical protein